MEELWLAFRDEAQKQAVRWLQKKAKNPWTQAEKPAEEGVEALMNKWAGDVEQYIAASTNQEAQVHDTFRGVPMNAQYYLSALSALLRGRGSLHKKLCEAERDKIQPESLKVATEAWKVWLKANNLEVETKDDDVKRQLDNIFQAYAGNKASSMKELRELRKDKLDEANEAYKKMREELDDLRGDLKRLRREVAEMKSVLAAPAAPASATATPASPIAPQKNTPSVSKQVVRPQSQSTQPASK